MDEVTEDLTNAEMMEALLVYNRPVSEEQCVKFVTQNGIQIHMIPEHMKTERVCMAAVKQRGSAIAFVPDGVITEEMCITACKYERVAECVALLLPKHMLTNRVVYQAIYTSKYGITTIDEPSEDMISLHKLLWEL